MYRANVLTLLVVVLIVATAGAEHKGTDVTGEYEAVQNIWPSSINDTGMVDLDTPTEISWSENAGLLLYLFIPVIVFLGWGVRRSYRANKAFPVSDYDLDQETPRGQYGWKLIDVLLWGWAVPLLMYVVVNAIRLWLLWGGEIAGWEMWGLDLVVSLGVTAWGVGASIVSWRLPTFDQFLAALPEQKNTSSPVLVIVQEVPARPWPPGGNDDTLRN